MNSIKHSHIDERKSGIVLHAKHAYMPNALGYCGPDDGGKILDFLHGASLSSPEHDRILRVLQGFEAAYPFIKFIAKSSQRSPFDLKVAEAYWIGNELLDRPSTGEFYSFATDELEGMRKSPAYSKRLFSTLGAQARPHHTFYALNLFLGTEAASTSINKILEIIDNCRISWAEVVKVRKDALDVLCKSVLMDEGDPEIRLGRPRIRRVRYDPQIPPFGQVKPGQFVSLHWNFACDILTSRQLKNIKVQTDKDIRATNFFQRINAKKISRR